MPYDVAIEFGPSSSPRLIAAVKVASTFPAYSFDGWTHKIEARITAETWPAVRNLWKQVETLSSARGILNGIPIDWHTWYELGMVFDCHFRQKKSASPDRYCVGQEAPGDDPRYIGCRYAAGASLFHPPSGICLDLIPEWWKFGTLDPDARSFLVDKAEILRLVEKESVIAKECPTWSMDRVRAVVDLLPSVLVVGQDWRLRYSALDPSRPIGVQPASAFYGGSFSLHERESLEEDL